MKVIISKIKNGVKFEVEGGEKKEFLGEKGESNSRNFLRHVEMVVEEYKGKGYKIEDKRK